MSRSGTLLLLFLCIVIQSTAQNEMASSGPDDIVKINFHTDIVKGGVPLGFEIRTNRKQSFLLSFIYTRWKSDNATTAGPGVGIEYRFYLPAKNPGIRGLYMGPAITYSVLTFKGKGVQASYTPGAAFIFGYQRVWKKHFALDLNAGLGLRVVSGSKELLLERTDYPGEGFIPRIGLAFGYAF